MTIGRILSSWVVFTPNKGWRLSVLYLTIMVKFIPSVKKLKVQVAILVAVVTDIIRIDALRPCKAEGAVVYLRHERTGYRKSI